MKRSALKRTTSPSRGYRLKSRSPQRQADERKYRCAKAEYQREHPNCEWPGCVRSLRRGDIIDVHHRAGRNGPLLYAKQYFASLCRHHHTYIEEHLSWARANGWIIDLSTEHVRALRLNE